MTDRAPRNRTLTCTPDELRELSAHLLELARKETVDAVRDRVINQDYSLACPLLPRAFADLLILDPPYNLTKSFNGHVFREKDADEYRAWFNAVLTVLTPLLRPSATVYVCSDWRTSALVYPVLEKHLKIRNRITWEREKGRGARSNWKNNTEDIWFCTLTNEYYFNVDAVMVKRKVIAPYRHEGGLPKDWEATANGNFRITYPSNLWNDITIPFWSMPENTDHPTQKPEKLMAKLILASSKVGDIVLDPFLGSGTSAVVARKLGRHYCGIETNREYCCWAVKRLLGAEEDKSIQGYLDGVFWERNSLGAQKVESEIQRGGANKGLFDD